MMALLEMRRIDLTARAVAFVFAVTYFNAFAQPEFDRAETDAQREVIEQIRQIQQQDGPNSEGLIDAYSGLALLYEESGNHFLASSVIRRALDVVRINHGLHSLERAQLLRRLVENEAVIGNVEEAWTQEQELLALAERHRDDLRTARILRESADRRMEILSRYDTGEFPREIVLGCYYYDPTQYRLGNIGGGVDAPDCGSGSRRQARRSILNEAQSFYAESINIILRNQNYSASELPGLLMDLVRSSYRYPNPELGRRSLQYLLAYHATNAHPWLTRIETLVQLADWDLIYSREFGTNLKESALATYEEAYETLKEHGVNQESIDRIFSPQIPIALPSFMPSPLVSEETSESTGHIDVTFVVARDGRAERIEILSSTMNVNRAAERDLVQSIKRSRFRPMLTDDRFVDSEPLSVRHYVTVR